MTFQNRATSETSLVSLTLGIVSLASMLLMFSCDNSSSEKHSSSPTLPKMIDTSIVPPNPMRGAYKLRGTEYGLLLPESYTKMDQKLLHLDWDYKRLIANNKFIRIDGCVISTEELVKLINISQEETVTITLCPGNLPFTNTSFIAALANSRTLHFGFSTDKILSDFKSFNTISNLSSLRKNIYLRLTLGAQGSHFSALANIQNLKELSVGVFSHDFDSFKTAKHLLNLERLYMGVNKKKQVNFKPVLRYLSHLKTLRHVILQSTWGGETIDPPDFSMFTHFQNLQSLHTTNFKRTSENAKDVLSLPKVTSITLEPSLFSHLHHIVNPEKITKLTLYEPTAEIFTQHINRMVNIKELTIERNDQSVSISLLKLPNLESLVITADLANLAHPGDLTTEEINYLNNFPRLKHISFGSTGKNIDTLNGNLHLPNLEHLELSAGKNADTILKIISGFSNLRVLYVSGNTKNASSLSFLKGLKKLEYLSICINLKDTIKHPHQSPLSKLNKLRYFKYFPGHKDNPSMLYNVVLGLPAIEYASMAYFKSTKFSFPPMIGSKTLKYLEVEGGQFNEGLLAENAQFPNLKVLAINRSALTPKALSDIKKLKSVNTLNLLNDVFWKPAFEKLLEAKQIRSLWISVRSNYGKSKIVYFDPKIIPLFKSFSWLRHLRVGSDILTPHHVKQFYKCTFLSGLYLVVEKMKKSEIKKLKESLPTTHTTIADYGD